MTQEQRVELAKAMFEDCMRAEGLGTRWAQMADSPQGHARWLRAADVAAAWLAPRMLEMVAPDAKASSVNQLLTARLAAWTTEADAAALAAKAAHDKFVREYQPHTPTSVEKENADYWDVIVAAVREADRAKGAR